MPGRSLMDFMRGVPAAAASAAATASASGVAGASQAQAQAQAARPNGPSFAGAGQSSGGKKTTSGTSRKPNPRLLDDEAVETDDDGSDAGHGGQRDRRRSSSLDSFELDDSPNEDDRAFIDDGDDDDGDDEDEDGDDGDGEEDGGEEDGGQDSTAARDFVRYRVHTQRVGMSAVKRMKEEAREQFARQMMAKRTQTSSSERFGTMCSAPAAAAATSGFRLSGSAAYTSPVVQQLRGNGHSSTVDTSTRPSAFDVLRAAAARQSSRAASTHKTKPK